MVTYLNSNILLRGFILIVVSFASLMSMEYSSEANVALFKERLKTELRKWNLWLPLCLPTEIPDSMNPIQIWEVINVNPTDFTGMLTANPNFWISDKGGRWSSVFKSWGLEADVQTEKHGAKKSEQDFGGRIFSLGNR